MYLRMASRGARVVPKDRDEPIAQIGPPQGDLRSWRERLSHEGRLRLGTQNWDTLSLSKLEGDVDIQASLRAVREDPNEVRLRGL